MSQLKIGSAIDYIIVGQGLAGTALATALLKRNKTIWIIDSDSQPSSSKVAAGLYNPITGRKMVKTWLADLLFPFLIQFYKNLETRIGQKFLHETRIYRPFISLEEQNEWMGKSASPEFKAFIHKVHTTSLNDHIHDPYGGIELTQSGYLNVSAFLGATREEFVRIGCFSSEHFDFKALDLSDGPAYFKGVRARKIIFCDGAMLTTNPHFNWLPLSPVKGEVLTVKSEANFEVIANRGVFCVPLGNSVFRVGSNYDNKDHSWNTTEKARQEIEDRLKQLIRPDFETIHQKAGIRPATKDRRPYIGLHPINETIGVFNGLGTKGVSLAPYFGEQFAAYLEENKQLDERVNISRYFSLYFNSQQ